MSLPDLSERYAKPCSGTAQQISVRLTSGAGESQHLAPASNTWKCSQTSLKLGITLNLRGVGMVAVSPNWHTILLNADRLCISSSQQSSRVLMRSPQGPELQAIRASGEIRE
jgi:hypothetical protein